MTVLIIGPNGSGKSAYAEKIAAELAKGGGGMNGVRPPEYPPWHSVDPPLKNSPRHGVDLPPEDTPQHSFDPQLKDSPWHSVDTPLIYIATMIPYGEEGLARVEKHRKRRESAGFVTVEKPTRVSEIPTGLDSVVLLEDVSNLLGNKIFGGETAAIPEESVLADITRLCASSRASVLVSISGLTARPEFSGETNNYIAALNRLNERLSSFADTVVEMKNGNPDYIKWDRYALA